jgi:hypothetical protein
MSDSQISLKTIMRRPTDCHPRMMQAFVDLVVSSGEAPRANLRKGLPAAEMLFFTVTEKTIVGVSCVRFPNQAYHKHLFEKAGVPEMYNPNALESCWLAVNPEYRGKGVWRNNRKIRKEYLRGRAFFAVHRVDNKLVGEVRPSHEYVQAGTDFKPDTSEDTLRLVVSNYDPVFDPAKKLRYRLPENNPTSPTYGNDQ